jgi:hypothetical protein
LIFVLVGCASIAIAQETWGTIIFKNVGILRTNGTSYNVPIWQDPTATLGQLTGAGLLFGGATAGLYRPGDSTPLATTMFGTAAQISPYWAKPIQQTVAIPGVHPGETTTLIVRVWQGADYATASAGFLQRAEWRFTTRPLGGVAPGGAQFLSPTMTGWGPENGNGLSLSASGPDFVWAHIESPLDGVVFVAPATFNVSAVSLSEGFPIVTNRSIFLNSTLVQNEASPVGFTFNASIGPLGAGKYSVYSVVNALSGLSASLNATSAPINITVVDPVSVVAGSARIEGDQIAFQYMVDPGPTYLIQGSFDLITWRPVSTNVPSASPAQFTGAYSPNDWRFYRVGRLPNP